MDDFIPVNKPVYHIRNKDLYSFVFLSVFTYLFIRLGVLNGFNLGLSIASVCLSLTLMIYVLSKDCKNKIITVLMYLISMVIAVSFSLHDNYSIKALSAFVLWFITVFSLNTANGTSLCNDGTYYKIFDVLYVGVVEPIRNIPKLFSAAISSLKGKNKFGMVILGVLVALPVIFVVIPLLSSADAAFSSIVKKLFSDVFLLIVSLVLTCILLPFITSYGFSLSNGIVKERGKVMNAKQGKASPIFINTFLCIVGFVYLVFLFSQLAYISDAFAFLLPEEFSMAEFARSGFFQMAAIAFINLFITFIVASKEKAKESGNLPVSTKILLTFFSLFSIFLIVNAFIRMSMYIDMYGLTQKRVITSVFMIMLCIIFVVVLVRIFNAKFKYINFILLICAATFVFVSVSDIDRNISKYNYNKYIAGEIEIDFEHYISLGNAAVPELAKLTKDDGLLTRELAYQALESVYSDEETSFFEQNLVKYRAAEILDKNIDENAVVAYFDEELYDYKQKVSEYNAEDFMPDLEKTPVDLSEAEFTVDAMFYEEDSQKTLELTLVYDAAAFKKTLGQLKSKYTFEEAYVEEDYTFYIIKSKDISEPKEFAAIGVCESKGIINYLWLYDEEVQSRNIADYEMFFNENFLLTIV